MPDILLLVLTWIQVLILDGCIIFSLSPFRCRKWSSLCLYLLLLACMATLIYSLLLSLFFALYVGFVFAFQVIVSHIDSPQSFWVQGMEQLKSVYPVLSQAFAVVRHIVQHVLFSVKNFRC